MDESLTETSARATIIDYMSRTLGTLPPGVSFRLSPPKPEFGGTFNPGTVAPCNDNDHDATGPVDLAINYWINGISSSAFDETLRSVLQVWRSWGWSTEENNEHGYLNAKARTPDGYTLIIDNNRVGGFSVTGASPCFPRKNAGTAIPQPEAIEHPTR